MPTLAPASRRVTRVQLGILLRDWRKRAGITSKQVADVMDWYQAKVTKLEKGGVKISSAEVEKLIELYGVAEEDAEKMRSIGKEARRRRAVVRAAEWAQNYVSLETAASEIKIYDGELVPGLIQTEPYARAALSTAAVLPPPYGITEEAAAEIASDRIQRQNRLFAEDAPQVWIVLGEAALHRLVGSAGILRDQLKLIRSLANRPNVTLQVLPFSTGEHISLGTPFRLLHLNEPAATFVYQEGLTDATYLDRPPHIEIYTMVFNRLLVAAADERSSRRILDRRIKDLLPHV